jgi:CBS domain-containing protein
MPKCKDVMTANPVCCEPGDSIGFVADIMKQEDVGSVPVIDAKGSNRLVGIVTDRDLVVKVLAGGRGLEGVTVRDAMTTNPASCREDDDVDEAMNVMEDRQVRRVPILDASGRVSGIIAQADVATRVNRDDRTGELVEAISDANSGASRR